MTTATARMSLGSVFGLIATTANAVSSMVNTAADSVSMLDNYVQKAKAQQVIEIDADLADYEAQVIEIKAQEASERQSQIEEFCARSPRHAQLYTSNHERLTAALAKAKADREARSTVTISR